MLGGRGGVSLSPGGGGACGNTGTSKKVTVSKDDTLILHGGGARDSIEERCALLKDSIAATASDYEKEKLQVRPSSWL